MSRGIPQAASLMADDNRPMQVAVLVCPRCGREDHMSAQAYSGWSGGIRCGLCGPPFVLMVARFTEWPPALPPR
jgi:hypothetical protein